MDKMDKMDKMEKGTLQTQSGKMAKYKVLRERGTFSSLCIDSFILNCYIRD